VKNLAKLALFFSLSFAVIFLAAAGIRFLELRVDWVRTLPQRPETVLTSLITAAYWALALALYGSILSSLSYAVRKRCFTITRVITLIVLPLVFSYAISLGLRHWEAVPPANNSITPLGENGLILSNALSRNETAIILLKGPADPRGPRVAAIPGQPLIYQAEAPAAAASGLPPIPFGNETPWFLKSLAIDIRLSSLQMQKRFSGGLIPFLIYTGSLIFLLSSFGFIFRLSAWPLANFAFGCLAFRGILALETFFNSQEMQDVFYSFLENRLPLDLAVPLIFCGFGLLVHIYSLLIYLAKKRDDYEV
jgi:hypothetical protein